MASFFPDFPREALVFIADSIRRGDPLDRALEQGLKRGDRICVWGRKAYPSVESWARKHDVELWRVEDGFIRSVGLGSDLTRPYSLVFDSRGIYFDPTVPSDLEWILNHEAFDDALLARARKLRRRIVEEKLSKYNAATGKIPELPRGRRIVLVPGQVEDDASIRYGGEGMSNLELLKQTRATAPDAYILYKPHPDVVAGNRVGAIDEAVARRYCDDILSEVTLDEALAVADEVHTITSLVGFEALLRGKTVHTYGLPFYAGWGLTKDRKRCARRIRRLSLDELTAGTLICYPRYVDPLTQKRCEIEETLEGLIWQREELRRAPLRRRILSIRNVMVRSLQRLGRKLSTSFLQTPNR